MLDFEDMKACGSMLILRPSGIRFSQGTFQGICLHKLVIEPVIALPQLEKLCCVISGSNRGRFRVGISVRVSGGRGSVEEMLPTLTSCEQASVAGREEGRLLFVL